jgi:hypothetical protein
MLHELRAMDGDMLEIDTQMELDASGGLPSSELGIDQEGTITYLTLRGGGPVSMDLGRVFSESRWDMELRIEMAVPDDGSGTSDMMMDMEIAMEVAPA